MNTPNLITIGRFLLVPLAVYFLLTGQFVLAFLVFVTAGISDGVDGYIARRFSQRTELGAYLDPLADKALLVSIYVVLGWLMQVPVWLVIAIVSRDFLIVGAVLLSGLLGRPVRVAPLAVSKANTAMQIVLAAVVLGELAFGVHIDGLRGILVAAVGGLTMASAAFYLVEWLRHMQGGGEGASR